MDKDWITKFLNKGNAVTKEEYCEAAWTELQNIEKGVVTIKMKEGDILSGPVKYLTNTGWTIVVLSDGDCVGLCSKNASHLPVNLLKFGPRRKKNDCEAFRRIRAYHPPPAQLENTWGFMC